jgi:hypothetical protein
MWKNPYHRQTNSVIAIAIVKQKTNFYLYRETTRKGFFCIRGLQNEIFLCAAGF